MNRINVYLAPEDLDDVEDYARPAKPELLGWFDYDKTEKIAEDADWDGSNCISVATGTQFDHQELLRTAQGRWVLHGYSQWQNVMDTYQFITDDDAQGWLLRNNRDEDVAKHFGKVEEERGPGRPKVGEQVCFTIGADDLAAVDAIAEQQGVPRSAVLRLAVAAFVASGAVNIGRTTQTTEEQDR